MSSNIYDQDKLKFLLNNNYIEHKYVKWGNSQRKVYIIDGKNINIKVMAICLKLLVLSHQHYIIIQLIF